MMSPVLYDVTAIVQLHWVRTAYLLVSACFISDETHLYAVVGMT